MRLTCVIITYKEPATELFRTLDSLNSQVSFDFKNLDIIISNDNGTPDESARAFYPNLNIRTTATKKNGGCGVNRQNALDLIDNTDYVFFMDCGDILAGAYVLYTVNARLEAEKPDLLTTTFLEQSKTGALLPKSGELSWVHGKYYRYGLGVRFADDIRTQEDSYYNTLFADKADKIDTINLVSYIWIYNNSSITRANDFEYTFSDFENYIRVITRAIGEVKRKGEVYAKLLSYCYTCFCDKAFMERARKYQNGIISALNRCIDMYHGEYRKLDKGVRSAILEAHKQARPKADYSKPFRAWFEELRGAYGQNG